MSGSEHTATTFGGPEPPDPSEPSAWVAVFSGTERALMELTDGAAVSVGRSRSCAIVIDEPRASRLHLTLEWDGGSRVRVADLESRNGTLVAGNRLDGQTTVGSGTEIQIGSTQLVVRIQPKRTSTATRAPATRDDAMRRTIELADRAAQSNVTVLVLGETGVGKEVIARYIHERSARSYKPWVAVNCGSIAESLAESMLFGHERGAFTGANEKRVGYFEAADGGTLFLDEVGELSSAMQARLLRAIDERAIFRVGSVESLPIDVRIIAATNRDLATQAREGLFRDDLFYRLAVLSIPVPPLRERPDDIEPLARALLREVSDDESVELSDDAIDALRAHAWPGNVRELRNVLTRSVAMRRRDRLSAADMMIGAMQPADGVLAHRMRDAERDAVIQALDVCRGNQTRTAKRLGISRRSLIYKLEKYGLKDPPAANGKREDSEKPHEAT